MEKSERRKQSENGEHKAENEGVGGEREEMGESHTNAAYNKYEFDTKNAIKMYERSSTKTHRAHTHTRQLLRPFMQNIKVAASAGVSEREAQCVGGDGNLA